MIQSHAQIGNLTYNAGEECYEALVTFHTDEGRLRVASSFHSNYGKRAVLHAHSANFVQPVKITDSFSKKITTCRHRYKIKKSPSYSLVGEFLALQGEKTERASDIGE